MSNFFILLIILQTFVSYSREFYKENEYIIPRMIWIFWDGEIHNVTRCMIHNLKQNVNKYKIIILNSNTICNYIKCASIPIEFKNLIIQIKADYYRFLLLYRYGGIWLDASTYIRNDIYLDELIMEMEEKKAELLAFNYRYHPSNNIEISCLFSIKNSKFIKLVLDEFEKGIKMGRLNYMEEKIEIENVEIKNRKIYDPEKIKREKKYNQYFFVNVCVQYVLQKIYNNKANIILKNAEDELFKFLIDCEWNITTMEDRWINDPSAKEYPIIKFTNSQRKKMRIPVDSIKII